MTVIASPVLPALVPEMWPHIEPLIASALGHACGENTPADVLERITAGHAHLWALIEPPGPLLGVMVAEIVTCPQQRLANAWLIAGTGMGRWLPTADAALEAWARERGCAAVIGDGRKGWLPHLKKLGYREVAVKYRKEL